MGPRGPLGPSETRGGVGGLIFDFTCSYWSHDSPPPNCPPRNYPSTAKTTVPYARNCSNGSPTPQSIQNNHFVRKVQSIRNPFWRRGLLRISSL